MTKPAKIGVLLANLGTPDSPTPKSISRYLWQFLTDPRVVDLPRCKWYPLLKAIILPLRSKRIAKNYQSIWTAQGSPLLAISRQQKDALQAYLDNQNIDTQVEIAMTYGNPSMQSAVKNLLENQVERIIVLPLYPQYSSSTTGAVFDAFANALKEERGLVPFDFIHSYHVDENYIDALVNSIKARLKPDEFLLFSYHGIPLRYEKMGDYYREHCKQTTIAVVNKLGLTENQWGMTFQSRFGREEWLQPYTDKFLESAATQNIQKIAVICPGFSVDCLETIEEIDEENRENFLTNGGQSYQYIPALNAEPQHIEMMGKLLLAKIFPPLKE
ncbi:ferrochelatase [Haemophilus haemolyticus]|uniref:Ferrochelatase n=1 Tax=Haemophilus haemolyticus TaxID=726 RepID=A0A1B8PCU1_HAEHA|nr:ferrochelatase [Haemophilus haemolyticus]OBX45569.1 ferrochelatase [Haemophilus haemolyticus]